MKLSFNKTYQLIPVVSRHIYNIINILSLKNFKSINKNIRNVAFNWACLFILLEKIKTYGQ